MFCMDAGSDSRRNPILILYGCYVCSKRNNGHVQFLKKRLFSVSKTRNSRTESITVDNIVGKTFIGQGKILTQTA